MSSYAPTAEEAARYQRRLIHADLEAQPPQKRAETIERARQIAARYPNSAMAKLLKHYESRDC